VIDACLALRREHALTAAEIADITVSGDQLLLDRGDRMVSSDRDARVSIHHCAAVAFLFGVAGLKEFSDETVHDPAVVALRARTTARLDDDSPRGAATVTVYTVDGRTLKATVLHAMGSKEHPLSDQDIEAKARSLAGHGGFGGSIDAVMSAVWQIDAMATIDPLITLLGGT
jgi:2-methylcitrate dehydratase PrpD